MTTIINGSSPSITFSDSTTQATAGLTAASPTITSGVLTYPDATTQASGSGVAKAWAQWNGTTTSGAVTIRKSYNVSSITAVATGEFTVNFTNAMADANYASVGSCSSDNAPAQAVMIMDFSGSTNSVVAPTTSAIRVFTSVIGAGKAVVYASLAIFD